MLGYKDLIFLEVYVLFYFIAQKPSIVLQFHVWIYDSSFTFHGRHLCCCVDDFDVVAFFVLRRLRLLYGVCLKR